jgi:hypothetical protein
VAPEDDSEGVLGPWLVTLCGPRIKVNISIHILGNTGR